MSKDNTQKAKSNTESTMKKSPLKPKGRSFCCSIFIYTFVFVSGVVVATILPDLAGHHFKQPYGKEYGVMAEKIIKDLPKHLKRLSETALALGRELVDRVWDLKAEVERRVNDMSNKKDDTTKTKTATQRSTTRSKDHVHTTGAHDTKQSTHTASKQTITITSTFEWVDPNSFDIGDRSSRTNNDL